MSVQDPTDRIERSRLLYERALLEGEAGALDTADRELDAVEADLALARGRICHGRFLEQRNEDPEQATEDPRELALFERAPSRADGGSGRRQGQSNGATVLVIRRITSTARITRAAVIRGLVRRAFGGR